MLSISDYTFGSVMASMPRKPSTRAKEFMAYIAANVRRRRIRAGLTQDDLAEAANLDATYITRIERAKVNPTVGILVQVADALDCSASDLLRPARMHEIVQGRPIKKS